MFCSECGAKIEQGEKFCGKCGAPVEDVVINDNVYQPQEVKKNDTSMKSGITISMIVAIVAMFVSAIAIGFIVYSINNYNDEPKNSERETVVEKTEKKTREHEDDEEETEKPKRKREKREETEPEEIETNEFEQIVPERYVRYSSALTYKRMSEIHSSYSADDYTFLEIADVIRDFDMQCEEYMNGYTENVPSQLKVNTTAYNQQVDFKKNHPNLTQRYLQVDIDDVRCNSDYYYAWVQEEIEKTENGKTQITTDYWVYKLQYNGVNWCIIDYTKDPAVK